MLPKLIGIVKRNLSGAKRRQGTASRERGAGKGAAALVPASAHSDPQRDQRSESKAGMTSLADAWGTGPESYSPHRLAAALSFASRNPSRAFLTARKEAFLKAPSRVSTSTSTSRSKAVKLSR